MTWADIFIALLPMLGIFAGLLIGGIMLDVEEHKRGPRP